MDFQENFIQLMKERDEGKISDEEIVEKFVAQCVNDGEIKAKQGLVLTQMKHSVKITLLYDLISEVGIIPKDKLNAIDELLTKSVEKAYTAIWDKEIEQIKNQLRGVVKSQVGEKI